MRDASSRRWSARDRHPVAESDAMTCGLLSGGLRLPRCPVASLLLALAAACATNPVTGRREFNLMSEAQEISHRPGVGSADQAGDGRLQRPRAAALRQRHRAAHGEDFRAAAPAVALHGRGPAGGQRVRGAGRVHLHHARHPAVPRQRGGAGRRAWATRSATSRRGTRRSSTRAQVGGQVGLVGARHLRARRRGRSASSRRRRSASCS